MSVARDFARLRRGTHTFAWRPPGRGHYRVRIEARGLSGPAGVELRTAKVKLPKPKPAKKNNKATPRQPDSRARPRDVASAASRRRPPSGLQRRRGEGRRAGDPEPLHESPNAVRRANLR